jgi:hypothetical protein
MAGGFYLIATVAIGISWLMTGLGAAWSRFNITHPDEMVTGTPGVLAVVFCAFYLFIQALLISFPLRELQHLSLSHRFTPDWRAFFIPGILSLILHGMAVWLPLKVGMQVLQEKE